MFHKDQFETKHKVTIDEENYNVQRLIIFFYLRCLGSNNSFEERYEVSTLYIRINWYKCFVCMYMPDELPCKL